MTAEVESIISRIAALDRDGREEVADFVVDSLDDEDWAADPEAAEAAWRDELQRRSDDFDSGREVGLTMDEVMAELQRRFPRP